VLRVILWSIGEYVEDAEAIVEAIDQIKRQIGSLPFELEKKSSSGATGSGNVGETAQPEEKRVRTKTVILADGTYGTQIVNEEEAKSKQKLMF
jgi:coatomer subunit beta